MRLASLRTAACRGPIPALAVLFAVACGDRVRVDEGMAITDVAIVDVGEGTLRPGMTVAIADDRITLVRPAGAVRLAGGVEEIPGRGRFLMPGLWDMHVHLQGTARDARDVDFPVYIANGITGVRLMAGCDPGYVAERQVESGVCMGDDAAGPPSAGLVASWRRDMAAGTLVGPRIVAASMPFDGPAPCGYGYALQGPDEARAMVARARQLGADFLKIYNCSLDADTYRAVADEARRLGIGIAGHVPAGVSLAEASAAGQAIEHATPKLLATCSSAPDRVAAALDTLRTRQYSAAAFNAYLDLLVRTFDLGACDDLIETFLANGTVFAPTFQVNSNNVFTSDLWAAMEADTRRAYLTPGTRARWDREVVEQTLDPDTRDVLDRYFQRLFRITAAMDRRGVPVLAGSDPPNLLVYPGFGLHDELALLVRAGLTPAAALRAATINPARYLGREADLGTVEEGKLADLVLLDENPLVDISGARAVAAVVAGGRLLDRAALDALLAGAREAAAP